MLIIKKKEIININQFLLNLQVNQTESHFAIEADPIDIDRYLPFKSSQKILDFCSDEDGLLSKRRHALLKKLKGTIDTSTLCKLVNSITSTLFEKEYMVAHKWPLKR